MTATTPTSEAADGDLLREIKSRVGSPRLGAARHWVLRRLNIERQPEMNPEVRQ